MIKSKIITTNQNDLIVLGFSFANLRKFLAEPGDTFIKINGSDLGIPFDILLFSGETEDAMKAMLKQYIGPNTVVKDERR